METDYLIYSLKAEQSKRNIVANVFIDQKLSLIFELLYLKFKERKISINLSKEYEETPTQGIVENLSDFIGETEAIYLQKSFISVPFIRITDKDISGVDYFKNNQRFYIFLKALFRKIDETYLREPVFIDYYSKSLFEFESSLK